MLGDKDAADPLDVLQSGGEFGAAVALIGADVGLAVLGDDLESCTLGEASAVLELARDRAPNVLGRLGGVEDRLYCFPFFHAAQRALPVPLSQDLRGAFSPPRHRAEHPACSSAGR